MNASTCSTLDRLNSVLQTKSGLTKSRFSLNDKLFLLDANSPAEETIGRVHAFQQLFAFRRTDGIATKPGQGPRAWRAYRGTLGDNEVIQHLLADRIPGRPPIWFGSRSFDTTKFFCLDVDADPSPEQTLALKYDLQVMPLDMQETALAKIKAQLPATIEKPSFAQRCSLVELALRRLGIHVNNPRHVLIQPTPRGGRHYYVFLDAPYRLSQIHELLQAACLRHVKGQVEFFPSASNGLRLPFGHLPGNPADPDAWIRFIDSYRSGWVALHSLAKLYDHLTNHQAVHHRRIESLKRTTPQQPAKLPTTPSMGRPKERQVPTPSACPDSNTARFLSLLEGIHSPAEAEELMNLGIRFPGTRTRVLMILAAHLIWFKNLSVETAARYLTDWAMSPRHLSKDIAADLANGTNKVAKQIATMCRWYFDRKQSSKTTFGLANREFAQPELTALRSGLVDLSSDDHASQAQFLLNFLRFAKRHGEPDSAGTGWLAAPAIRSVIRRWPGCHHMNYSARINHAIFVGSIEVVKEAWHRPNGLGRARTYRLIVPVISQDQWNMSYEVAFDRITQKVPLVSTLESIGQPSPLANEETFSCRIP